MAVPELQLSSQVPSEAEADVLVLGVQKTDAGPKLLTDDPAFTELGSQLSYIGFAGSVDELRRLPAVGAASGSVALIGIGSTVGGNELRYAAGSATRQLRGAASIALALPASTDDELGAVLEGGAIGAYAYNEFRTPNPETAKLPASRVAVLGSSTSAEALIERALAVGTALNSVRDLVNMPSSHLYPESFALETVELAKDAPVTVDILREPELIEGDFGGIIGVGQGSVRGPRLVKVTYSPAKAKKHLALVGKGITFDTGGISLKPPASMVGMKYDMTGAATVLAVTLAAARLALPVKITAWLCIAENMPSGSAIKPNDVLRIRGGKTVEVLNTDAEGRLVLADGLVAASEEHPDAIVDVATLTGAQRIALGDRYSGAMGDEDLVGRIVAISKRIGETIWPMPLPAEIRALLNSDVADIANAKPGNTAAGMLVGGVFLSEFVGTNGEGADKHPIPWAHLDIAGPSHNTGAGYGFTSPGPTGVTVRSLLSLAEEYSVA